MKAVLFTSNATRHKFVANALAKEVDDMLAVSECKPSDAPAKGENEMDMMEKHFYDRYRTEQKYFKNNDAFLMRTFPIVHQEVNMPSVYEVVKNFKPDAAFVFGASIIREQLLSLIPRGRFINMHLGLSPYYRGSATNFWPFVNCELEYVGATLLHIDSGIDTGDIIAHIRPKFEKGDNVHTAGCKTIQTGTEGLIQCLKILKSGRKLNRVKQWEEPNAKFYKKADFTEDVLKQYFKNLEEGVVDEYLKNLSQGLKLVNFN